MISTRWPAAAAVVCVVVVAVLEARRRARRRCLRALAAAAAAQQQQQQQQQRVWPTWVGLAVGPSRVPGGGDGLFATRPFHPGETVAVYRGRVLTLAQALRLKNRDYLMGFGLNVHVDAAEAFAVPGRYVNDNFDRSKLNARFDKSVAARRATVVATKLIEAGDEIYASYGETYWRARRVAPATGDQLPPAADDDGPLRRRL